MEKRDIDVSKCTFLCTKITLIWLCQVVLSRRSRHGLHCHTRYPCPILHSSTNTLFGHSGTPWPSNTPSTFRIFDHCLMGCST
ncbi:hypothetical protein Y032_0773g2232 [Ancylostoma ceylanicum]|uniref:Uncharacterized protein n=1 Tax=Ancylostoma ceylanicum TaxID=53326 RepID=A0A016WF90_9BILA|nr:hypothetical protein Y032_0773g2232 [Ancylostoma ceylanicum]